MGRRRKAGRRCRHGRSETSSQQEGTPRGAAKRLEERRARPTWWKKSSATRASRDVGSWAGAVSTPRRGIDRHPRRRPRALRDTPRPHKALPLRRPAGHLPHHSRRETRAPPHGGSALPKPPAVGAHRERYRPCEAFLETGAHGWPAYRLSSRFRRAEDGTMGVLCHDPRVLRLPHPSGCATVLV